MSTFETCRITICEFQWVSSSIFILLDWFLTNINCGSRLPWNGAASKGQSSAVHLSSRAAKLMSQQQAAVWMELSKKRCTQSLPLGTPVVLSLLRSNPLFYLYTFLPLFLLLQDHRGLSIPEHLGFVLTTLCWPACFLFSMAVPVRAALGAGRGQCSAALHLPFNAQFFIVKPSGCTCHISCKRNTFYKEENFYIMHEKKGIFMCFMCCSRPIRTPVSLWC